MKLQLIQIPGGSLGKFIPKTENLEETCTILVHMAYKN